MGAYGSKIWVTGFFLTEVFEHLGSHAECENRIGSQGVGAASLIRSYQADLDNRSLGSQTRDVDRFGSHSWQLKQRRAPFTEAVTSFVAQFVLSAGVREIGEPIGEA
jgi:hypothetical protein